MNEVYICILLSMVYTLITGIALAIYIDKCEDRITKLESDKQKEGGV